MGDKNVITLFSEEKATGKMKNLIPVHINKMRCEKYFWNWDTKLGDWVRGQIIPPTLAKMYNNPKN